MIDPVLRHSAGQKAFVENAAFEMVRRNRFSRREAYVLLAELAQHGSPAFPVLSDFIRRSDNSARMTAFHDTLCKDHRATSHALNAARAVVTDSATAYLLDPARPVFFNSHDDSKPLIVVFTTAYNNFYMSNAVLASLLTQAGHPCLFVKDPSEYQFTTGIAGFGETWDTSIDALAATLPRLAKGRPVIATGFSSSGFSAVLAAIALKADAVVGFSIRNSLSPHSALPRSRLLTPAMYDRIPAALKCDLAPVLSASDTQVRLYYGALNEIDKRHALSLSHVPQVCVSEVKDTGHTSPRPFLHAGTLVDTIAAATTALPLGQMAHG
ncbi:hypothetical protein [Celeribacter sp.]|uniref:hypothetical protein n=1 Tax=Celeribacter sp. TaxID=1890673 RepID=UPI003A909E1F